MLNQMRHFLKDQSGAAAVEYALIASGISVVIIPSVNNLGSKLVVIFTQITNTI
jgi:pilus assembly protein Flp/PilA